MRTLMKKAAAGLRNVEQLKADNRAKRLQDVNDLAQLEERIATARAEEQRLDDTLVIPAVLSGDAEREASAVAALRDAADARRRFERAATIKRASIKQLDEELVTLSGEGDCAIAAKLADYCRAAHADADELLEQIADYLAEQHVAQQWIKDIAGPLVRQRYGFDFAPLLEAFRSQKAPIGYLSRTNGEVLWPATTERLEAARKRLAAKVGA